MAPASSGSQKRGTAGERSTAGRPALRSSGTHVLTRSNDVPERTRRRAICRALAIALVALFLASVARFYHRGTGFTSLIGLPEDHGNELPALRATPHYVHPAGVAYDGQYYAQLALEPLLRDPAIDRAIDVAPYRARRILFSWTAWVAGLGRPAWVLEAFALQNVVCWLILAALLTRWLPPDSPRQLASWSACLLAFGLLWSVRFALLDGPSLLLLTCAIVAAERGRPLVSAAIVGLSGLARETNLLGAAILPLPSDRASAVRLLLAACVIILPLAIWLDYLWSIYRTTTFAATDQFTMPFVSYVGAGRRAVRLLDNPESRGYGLVVLLSIVALSVQSVYLAIARDRQSPWWRLAVPYALLMLVVDRSLWEPGGINRFLLPLTVGFNVQLSRSSGPFWTWLAAGNLTLLPTVWRLLTTGWVL
jgi:hypothetical protein